MLFDDFKVRHRKSDALLYNSGNTNIPRTILVKLELIELEPSVQISRS